MKNLMTKLMSKKNKKGFTLAELLIVVAIIAVLVAVSIPVFTTQLNKAKLATDTANVRASYAEFVADKLVEGEQDITVTADDIDDGVVNGSTVEVDGRKVTVTLGKNSNTFTLDDDVNKSGS